MTRTVGAAVTAVLALLYAGLLAAALVGSIAATFAFAVAVFVVDNVLELRAEPELERVLNAAGAGPSWRTFIRDLLIVVALVRAGHLSTAALCLLVGAILAHHVLFGLYNALSIAIRAGRMRRIETRNLDVPGADLPAPLPDRLVAARGVPVLATDIALIVGLGWRLGGTSSVPVAASAIVMVALSVAVVALLLPQVIALLRLPNDELRLQAAQRAVLDLEPLVILYFSGGKDSAYQVNMWFETMSRLERPALVLLRERRYLDELAETTVPILCMPFSVDLMNFRMPSARVALYVANVGRNIHLLREPGLKSAFIGHGDSDKIASFNPFSKVYDEVWVAGEAGRQRYARADIGVRDEDIVLVGRPQLEGIHEARPRPGGAPFTVLYAPTWEGWTEDLNQSSVLPMGAEIVQTLLATPGVRVVYKPHPLTGSVDKAAGVANDRVLSLVTAAGAPHVAAVDPSRSLYDWFNESDALISDVSSVVSDYLRSGKPYFVSNPAGLPDAEFRDQNPSAGAAYLVGPGASGLADGLATARSTDDLRERRLEVRTFLLGDPAVDPMILFRAAVDALASKAKGQSDVIASNIEDELTMDLGESSRATGSDRVGTATD